jgi:hypothetical protein
MISGDDKHRAFLRRAVSPNLFTTTLHPEFIPALVAAHLMTPCLWEWAEKCMHGVDTSDPTAAFRAIQRFLNRNFYHATGEDFAAVWGLQETRHLRELEEREASDYAMGLMEGILSSVGDQHPWTLPLIPLLQDGLFPLYVYGTADVLRAHSRRIGKRQLGVTSCLDECVLAAALAIVAGVGRWEDMIFVGSPLHYTVFFPTSAGTVWLNAKREFFTETEWQRDAGSEPESARRLMDKLLVADRLIGGCGLAVFPKSMAAGDCVKVDWAVTLVERFAGGKIPWLHPLADYGDPKRFDGWEAVSGNSAEAVRAAVFERARKGGAPLLEATLYIVRDPDFCDPELILEAARSNFHTYLRSAAVTSPEEISALVEAVPGRVSFLGPTGRMALPDEMIAFGTASEVERELFRQVVREHVSARQAEGGVPR